MQRLGLQLPQEDEQPAVRVGDRVHLVEHARRLAAAHLDDALEDAAVVVAERERAGRHDLRDRAEAEDVAVAQALHVVEAVRQVAQRVGDHVVEAAHRGGAAEGLAERDEPPRVPPPDLARPEHARRRLLHDVLLRFVYT